MKRTRSTVFLSLAFASCVIAVVGGCEKKQPTRPAVASRPAAVAPTKVAPPSEPVAVPAAANAELDREQLRSLRGGGSFFGRPDGDIRERLATLPIKELKRGYGGRSVAFKITLEDGTTGYYKPAQTFSAAHWWSEVAAYHLDRLLGLGRTPPVVSRRFPWDVLRRTAPDDEHFPEVIVDEDGTVPGSFSYWVPDRLVSISLPAGWERWVRVQGWPTNAISPFVRPREYTEALRLRDAQRAAASGEAPTPTTTDGTPPAAGSTPVAIPGEPQVAAANPVEATAAAALPVAPENPDQPTAEQAANTDPATVTGTEVAQAAASPSNPERAAELSDLLVFDFLTLNTDRWGGGNANVLTRGGREVVFLDNAAGFPNGAARNGLMDSRLRVVQRFRRSTIDAIRALDTRALMRRMQSEPCAPILTEAQIGGLALRRRVILERVAEMQAQFGDAALPW